MRKVRRLRDLSLTMKIVAVIACVCLVLSVGNYMILQNTYQAYDEQLYIHTAQMFTSFVGQVDTRFSQVDILTISLITNSSFQDSLIEMRGHPEGSTPWLAARDKVSTYLHSYLYGIDMFYNFAIYLEDGERIGTNDGLSANQRDKLIHIAAESRGRSQLVRIGRNVYYIRQIIGTMEEEHVLGTMIARVNILKLMQDCLAIYNNAGIGLNLSIHVDDTLIYPNGESTVQPLAQDGWQIQGDRFVVQCTNSLGWRFLLHSSYDEIHKSMRMTEKLSIILTVIIALVAFLCSYYLVKRSTRHLQSLLVKIDAYRDGILPEKKEMILYQDRNDECGRLHRHFDRMAYDNKKLNDEAYDRMLLQKEAQYQQLQQQIQPHFIFNTMSLITWIAYEHDDQEIADLSTSLSRLLRTSMSFDDKTVCVRDELKIVEDYMLIQTKRFGSRLRYEMCIPQELLDVKIPQLTIQPLVENSIKYALEEMLETCQIRLTGRVEGDTAVLIVEDNGPGIDTKILQKLESNEIAPKGHGIGMQNIKKRIQLLFSEEHGLQVHRVKNKTQIHVRVPYRCVDGQPQALSEPE